VQFSQNELETFFNRNQEDYSFSEDVFLLNYISFTNEERAILFREKALELNWSNAFTEFENDSTLYNHFQNHSLKLSDIQSKRISRVIDKLYQNEISLVMHTELNNFVVVQQIDKIPKNSIPNFDYVKSDVEQSYLMLKQRKMIKDYLDSLITKKNVKIF
jgi:hypothetical protein